MSTAIKFSLADAARMLADSSESSVVLATHGEARLLLYAPEGVDTQTPHKRDEVYVVVSGSGTFRRGDETTTFVAGDMLFVGASVEHRFENFTDDFQTWVIFFGPEGGSI